MESRPVLYAEDDENDAFLMQRAFKKAGILNPLHIATDGAEAIAYLAGEEAFSDRARHPLPCLLLLDLNLPRRSGLEVLKWVREQPALHSLPAVILTSSNQDRDINAAAGIGANGYLVKPPSSEKLIAMVTSLREQCLTRSATPGGVLELAGNLLPSSPTPR